MLSEKREAHPIKGLRHVTITTLSVEKADLERFMHARLKHQAIIKSELSNSEFFRAMMEAWEKNHKED